MIVKPRVATIAWFLLSTAVTLFALGGKNTEATEDTSLQSEIRSYLLENPEIITEALEVLRARRHAEAQENIKKALVKNSSALYDSAGDPVLGNPYGDVTVVMFSDYQCGYCKQAFSPLMRMVENDKGLRVIMKELPILGQMSTLAARYGLGANVQGRYQDFYEEMMKHKGPVTRNLLRQKAQTSGLNMTRLDQDIMDKSIAETLTKNKKIAMELGLQGTPAFIIGSEIFPGALEYDTLKEAIRRARST